MSTDNSLSLQQTFDLMKTYNHMQVYIDFSSSSCGSYVLPSSSAVLKKRKSGSSEIITQKGLSSLIIGEDAKVSCLKNSEKQAQLELDINGAKMELLLF